MSMEATPTNDLSAPTDATCVGGAGLPGGEDQSGEQCDK